MRVLQLYLPGEEAVDSRDQIHAQDSTCKEKEVGGRA